MALPPEKLAQLKAAQKVAQDKELEQSKELINSQDIGYTSKLFVQALFPYRKTDQETRRVESSEGTIFVASASGLPYGKYPRLIMAYIITRAVENAGRYKDGKIDIDEACHIPLGHSMNDFLHAIGVAGRGTGGSTGNLASVREQLLRLASSSINVQEKSDTPRARGGNITILDDWDLWFDPKHPAQDTIIESHLVLTPKFFKHIAESPIPIDLEILRQLKKPRSMDVYIWLTLKQFWLQKNNRESFTFSWKEMATNFSTKPLTSSQSFADFRRELKAAIHDIVLVWPTAGIETATEGVVVIKTAPSIAPKKPRVRAN